MDGATKQFARGRLGDNEKALGETHSSVDDEWMLEPIGGNTSEHLANEVVGLGPVQEHLRVFLDVGECGRRGWPIKKVDEGRCRQVECGDGGIRVIGAGGEATHGDFNELLQCEANVLQWGTGGPERE